MFKIDEGGALPQVTLQFVASDDLSGPVHKEAEDLERLALKPYGDSVLAEIARGVVVLERTEDHFGRRVRLACHTRIEILS